MLNSLASIASHHTKQFGGAKLSGKVQFSGTNSLTTIQSIAFGTTQFTVECWVKLGNVSTSGQCFIGFGTSTAGFGIYYNHFSDARFSLSNETGSKFAGTSVPVANTWYHIAIQRNSGNRIQVFINGILESTSASTYTANLSMTGYQIGKSYSNNASNPVSSGTQITGIRFSNIARYSANFTPSPNQIPHGLNTFVVFNFKDATTYLQAENNAYSLTNNGSVTWVSGYP